MIVGPLLARFGVGYIPKPGGDKIGRRRLDTHFEGFAKLGATFNYDGGEHFYSVECKKLKGTYIHLEEASVTGTANVVMAAVMASGKTTFYNAACEPYIQQLCKMLNSMGAKISGVGSNMLIIEGVKSLGGCYHRVNPDMIEPLEASGLKFVGKDETGQRCEIFELEGHPYYVGVQYHPEFKSRPNRPSPPFLGLLKAATGQL